MYTIVETDGGVSVYLKSSLHVLYRLKTSEDVAFTDQHLYMTINSGRCTVWQSLALQLLLGRCGSLATGFEVQHTQ